MADPITVHCPSCQTAFPVDPDKVPEGGVNARCSECEEVFRVEAPAEESGSESETFGGSAAPEGLPGLDVAEAEVEADAGGAAASDTPPPTEPPDLEKEEELVPGEATEEPAATMEKTGIAGPELEAETMEGPELEAPEPDGSPDLEIEPDGAEDEGPAAAEAAPVEEPGAVPVDVGSEAGAVGAETEELETPEVEAEEAETGAETGMEAARPAFGNRSPEEKAQRLARVLVSDMITYNPNMYETALARGTLKEDFAEEIEKSWEEYVEQVGEDLATSTSHWTDALNEILAKGENTF